MKGTEERVLELRLKRRTTNLSRTTFHKSGSERGCRGTALCLPSVVFSSVLPSVLSLCLTVILRVVASPLLAL